MKRIILGLGMLLILAQNGFANTDAKYKQWIKESNNQVEKQILKCENQSINHKKIGNAKPCLKAINLIEKLPNKHIAPGILAKDYLGDSYLNAGLLYYFIPNYTKSYQYLKKAANIGSTNAEKALDILCREHSWACK